MRETHEGPSQSCCGYLLTPLAATTHLRRLRLGDLSRWVRRGWSCRAQAKARASSPCPTRSGTSRYKRRQWIDPPNLTSARLLNTVIAKHLGAPWRSAGGVIRQCGPSSRQHPPSDFAAKSRARAPSMGANLEVKVLPETDHRDRRELQLREGDRPWRGSRERNRGSTYRNRI
jgi:hypothetical protein